MSIDLEGCNLSSTIRSKRSIKIYSNTKGTLWTDRNVKIIHLLIGSLCKILSTVPVKKTFIATNSKIPMFGTLLLHLETNKLISLAADGMRQVLRESLFRIDKIRDLPQFSNANSLQQLSLAQEVKLEKAGITTNLGYSRLLPIKRIMDSPRLSLSTTTLMELDLIPI